MGKRRMFYLTDLQFERLSLIAKKTGLSASEILRRAFDEYWERIEKKAKKISKEDFLKMVRVVNQEMKKKGGVT